MPVSKEKLRVTRSTASTRSKASVKKYTAQKPRGDRLSSPGWVTGHADLFKLPNRPSPCGPKTRRSSIYQKAASPSRYRNARIPASNCRKIRPLKTSMSNSPPNAGVTTRSRRASAIHVKAETPREQSPNPQRDNPVMENQPGTRGGSQKSVRSKPASSRASVASKEPEKPAQRDCFPMYLFPDSVMQEFPEDSSDSLDVALSAVITTQEGQRSSPQASAPEQVPSRQSVKSETARSTRSSVKCRTRSKTPSAVSVASTKSKKPASPEKSAVSITGRQATMQSVPPMSVNSVSPMPNSTSSVSPTLSDYIIIPCESDPEISFNTSRQETPRKPASKRFLESIEDSPPPVATRSFYPPASKIPKLALPTVARSEKLLTGNTSDTTPSSAENCFDFRSPVTSFNTMQKMSVTDSNLTSSDDKREFTLRDISNSPSLDTTAPPEAFQTPMTNRTCCESETFYETPQVSKARNLNIQESLDFSENLEERESSVNVSPASSGRCVIL